MERQRPNTIEVEQPNNRVLSDIREENRKKGPLGNEPADGQGMGFGGESDIFIESVGINSPQPAIEMFGGIDLSVPVAEEGLTSWEREIGGALTLDNSIEAVSNESNDAGSSDSSGDTGGSDSGDGE